MPINLAGGGHREAAKHAQHGGFTRTGWTQQGQDFAGKNTQVSRRDDLNAVLTGLSVIFFDLFCANYGIASSGLGWGLDPVVCGWILHGFFG